MTLILAMVWLRNKSSQICSDGFPESWKGHRDGVLSPIQACVENEVTLNRGLGANLPNAISITRAAQSPVERTTARSLRSLTDYLERNPRGLIFGKPESKQN